MTDVLAQFRDAIEATGLTPPDEIIGDGQLHRFPSNGRAGDDSGWYVLHLDGVPAGALGCWRSNVSENWRADIGRELTDEEKRAHRVRMDEARRQREAEQQRRQVDAGERAARIWRDAEVAGAHPYLEAKGVASHGLRLHEGSLLVPVRTATGELVSLQFIDERGAKRFLGGGRVAGGYHAIGGTDDVLCIAEGYATAASVHEATGYAVAVAFNAGNLRPVAEALRAKFPGVRLIVAGDHDASGVGQKKACEAASAVAGSVATPRASGTDWNDVHQNDGPEAVRAGIDSARPVDSSVSGAGSGDAWSEPAPLPDGLPPVPPFDFDLLPEMMRNRVSDIADRMQCPPDFPAVAMMVMLSGIIGRRLPVRPKRRDDWTVVPNVWGMAIGRPGIMKSPALDEVLRPLRAVQARAMDEHRGALENHEAERMVRAERKKAAQKAIQAAIKKGDQSLASDLAHEAVAADDEAPVCRRWLVNDCTVEKLGVMLSENPDGLLLYRDELPGFFRTLERQGHEADRAFFLEAWNGDGTFTFDRIGRGTVHIDSVCLAIFGSIQPGPLSALVRQMRGSGDDGLLQRFQLAVWPDQAGQWKNVDRAPDYAAREEIDALIGRIAGMEPPDQPLHFDEPGQRVFDNWRTELEGRLRSDLHPMIEAHLAKYRSLVPSLALLCHVAEASAGFAGPIAEVSVIRAIGWAEYLEPHANRIYAPAVAPDLDAARALAARIRAGDVGARFSLRDIYNNGWSGLATRDEVAAAVSVLADYDWLREDREQTTGRTRILYTLNPSLLHEP